MNLLRQIHLVERLDQLIRLKSTGTPKELASRLGMSESTLYRLIYEMKALGFPIVYFKDRSSYAYEKKVHFTFKVITVEDDADSKRRGQKSDPHADDFFPTVNF